MKRLEVKVLARICGKSSGEAGLLKRVLRYDAATESFFWCIGKRFVQDAAATLQLTLRVVGRWCRWITMAVWNHGVEWVETCQ